MGEYRFATHGVATVVEYPQSAKLIQHRGDLGTVVEQEAGTYGWFHIPLTTPNQMDGDEVELKSFWLDVNLNENAKMTRIDLRYGQECIYRLEDLSVMGLLFGQGISLPEPVKVSNGGGSYFGYGLTLCLRIEFLSGEPRGRVEFYSAAAHFET